jgi:hypothetical protein
MAQNFESNPDANQPERHTRYTLSDASPATLARLEVINDLKNSRGLTSSEAMNFIRVSEKVDNIRSEVARYLMQDLPKFKASDIEYMSPKFIDTFKDHFPRVIGERVQRDCALKSTTERSLTGPIVVELGHSTWFSVGIFDSTSKFAPLLSSCMTPSRALALFHHFLVHLRTSETIQEFTPARLGGHEVHGICAHLAESPFHKFFDPVTHDVHSYDETVSSLMESYSAPFNDDHIFFRADYEETEDTAGSELDPLDRMKSFTSAQYALTIEEFVDRLNDDVATRRSLGVRNSPSNLYKRYCSELQERTVWAERRVAIAALEEAFGGAAANQMPEQVINESISRALAFRNDYSAFLNEMKEKGIEVPSLIDAGTRERFDLNSYLYLALVKNKKFLLDFFK